MSPSEQTTARRKAEREPKARQYERSKAYPRKAQAAETRPTEANANTTESASATAPQEQICQKGVAGILAAKEQPAHRQRQPRSLREQTEKGAQLSEEALARRRELCKLRVRSFRAKKHAARALQVEAASAQPCGSTGASYDP